MYIFLYLNFDNLLKNLYETDELNSSYNQLFKYFIIYSILLIFLKKMNYYGVSFLLKIHFLKYQIFLIFFNKVICIFLKHFYIWSL